MKFVHSTKLDGSSKQIKEVLKGADVCIASAFLGIGAEAHVPNTAKVICDITMGGTNPEVLTILRARLGDNLRQTPDFHAKVYISDKGCVIGSANLSSNGVGFLSQAKLMEAAVIAGPDADVTKDAAAWFENIWNDPSTTAISDADIEWARERWKANKRGTPQGKDGNYEDFLEALKDSAGVASQWKFILTNEEMSDDAEEAAKKEQLEILKEASRNAESEIDVYEDLSGAESLKGHYIGLHVDPEKRVAVQAMQFLGTRKVLDGDEQVNVSYFAILDWDTVGIPKPSRSQLQKNGHFSKAIDRAKGKFLAESISAKKAAKVLTAGNLSKVF